MSGYNNNIINVSREMEYPGVYENHFSGDTT